MKFTSIRLRVILLVIAMAVPIVLLGIGGTLYYQSILKQNIWDDELNMAKTISVMTPEYMNSSQLYLKSVADRPLVIKAMEDNDTAYLSSQAVYANETDRINSAYFTDNKGNVIASTQNISSMIGSNVKNRSYMGDVLRTGDPVIGDGEPGYDKMPVVPIGLPIKDGNGTILGVLVGTVDLNVYSEMIRETAVKDQQIVYLVNRTGHIMIHNNPQYVRTMANFSSVQSVQDMLHGESGVTEYYNPIENVTRLGAYVPIEPMGWGVVVALPTSIAYQPAWNAGYLFVGGTALLTLGAILLGLFLANGITSPILRLSLATKKISSKSDYAQLIPLDRKDEIGDLAHSFKGMVDDIQNKQEELEVQNEETRENNLELQKQILERKRAEEALRESEGRFRATFEQAAVGIAQLDPDGRFIRINERYCDIVGYTHDEMLERTFQDITYPADLEENQRNVQRLLDGEITTYTMEKRYVRKDGSPVWVYLTVSLEYNEDGSPKYLIAVVEDITERKQAEEALRESEERFRQLADNSPIPMAINDKNDNITYLNKKFIEIFGYTLEDIPHLKYWWSLAYPDPVYREDAIKRWEKGVKEAIKGSREIVPIDYTVTCKDGSVRNIEISGVPIGDKELVLLQDVTERKRAVEALRKSEASLAKAQRITHMGNYVLDLKKDWAICSDEFYSILGVALQDHFSYKSYLARVHPDDREMFDNVVQEAIAQGKTFSTDSRIVRPDGSERVVHAEGEMVLDKSGRSIQMFGTIQDITERKQAEDALRTSEANLANAQRISHLGNWSWDTKRDEVRCSNEFYRIFGIEIQEFITYEQFINMLHPQDREPVNKAVDAALYMGAPYRIDYRVIWPDDSEHIIHAEAVVSLDGAGKPISMFGTVQDITEQRLAEIELQKAKAMVEMYNDLLGHDINNINQVGIGYLELAIETLGLSDEGKKLLSKPLEALINSSKLIENVRKLQHIKSGDIKHKAMDVNQVLLDIKNSYSNVKDRSIAINYSPVSVCMVAANELLRDVFSNLVENAIKHSTGKLEIDIGLSSVFENGREYCRVYVEDNGPGIPDSIKDKLFTRFQRGDTKASGKGLGLYLVKTLVEDYGGRVWVEDRVQGDHTKGARFVVLLPALRD